MTGLKLLRGRPTAGDQIFLTIVQVAEPIQVSPRTVRKWVKARYLVAHRIGGVVRIGEIDLLNFMALHRDG